jgi:hypothetical protein
MQAWAAWALRLLHRIGGWVRLRGPLPGAVVTRDVVTCEFSETPHWRDPICRNPRTVTSGGGMTWSDDD